MKIDIKKIEQHANTLGQIAENYSKNSKEATALFAAAHALWYGLHRENRKSFEEYLRNLDEPPTALQILHAKLCGIEDLPHELTDETLREVEAALERLRTTRHSIPVSKKNDLAKSKSTRQNCELTQSPAKRDAAIKQTAAIQDNFPSGLSQPALRALANAGYTQLNQLRGVPASELLKLHGMGPKGVRILTAALKTKN
jgi:hypothetical protein